MIKADIVVGLQYGDEGKGKVTNHLAKNDNYHFCLRFNGGSNAGHTIYNDNKKMVTHQVPTGLIYGSKSIIGNGCVINLEKLAKEVKELELPDSYKKNIFISPNAHVVTQHHIEMELAETKIGTTKQGIGPAYIDKYSRTGIQYKDVADEHPYKMFDIYSEFLNSNGKVLCEGAQGFGIDIDWGEYPFVTSSQCTVAAAIQNGVPFNCINKVYGVAKAYETYVGSKEFEPKNNEKLQKVQELGQEFGATTGRRRQCNWLNVDLLMKSVYVNSVTDVIINKLDILEQLNYWYVIYNGKVINLESKNNFIDFVENTIYNFKTVKKIIWSTSPHNV